MNEEFTMNKAVMAQIINEIKSLQLHRYDDYVRVVGIVSFLESGMKQKKPTGAEPEEVEIDG